MVQSVSRRSSSTAWHEGFLRLLPAIRLHATVSFRRWDSESRAEAIQNCICNAAIAYARLYELGKVELAYAGALGRYAVAQTRQGRIVGNRTNVRDVSSSYAQSKKGLVLERLDHFDKTEESWEEIVIEDRHAGPFDIVRTKLDFRAWLRSLPIRLRRIAKFLAGGETTAAAATKFGVSPARISQIRSELLQAWQRFQGEALAVPA
jgi:hypothetical protein